jgi:pyruvate kinase
VPGCEFKVRKRHLRATVEQVPCIPGEIILKAGDSVLLSPTALKGRPATYGRTGKLAGPAIVTCSVPELFSGLRTGEPVWFDDGKIGGVVRRIAPEGVAIEVTAAKPSGTRLREGKGINVPETKLDFAAVTPADLKVLDFVIEHADLVGLSFVSRPRDISELYAHLDRSGSHLGVVLKIETRRGFEALPQLLLSSLRRFPVGVMIARGDLGVECGFERLAELQEEILWFSEAAHLPVIWATQVLETMAQKGQPTRAEITDAAMGERAECVMLNKGAHILEAAATLDGILRRMQDHQAKKTSRLRQLHVSGADVEVSGPGGFQRARGPK